MLDAQLFLRPQLLPYSQHTPLKYKSYFLMSYHTKGSAVNYETNEDQILKYTYLFELPVIFRTVWTYFRKVLSRKFQENLFSWNGGVPCGR
jgi:hypothetical protein